MSKRRSRGDGGLHWDERRQRWIATASLGFDAAGKRIVKRGSGRTKTEAKNKLKEVLRDHEDGLAIGPGDVTVADAVNDWLKYGLSGRSEKTVKDYTDVCMNHVIPAIGARKLRELGAQDVDRWLAAKSASLSTRTLRMLHSCLNRSVKRAMARDKVKRNVVELCSVPTGQAGRPSKALTLAQAHAVLNAAEGRSLHAYVVVSLLTGARTEEMRSLTWDHVDLYGGPDMEPPIPPYIAVWRSVRAGSDTKTRKSRRTLALPARCVEALTAHREQQQRQRKRASKKWHEHGLVFASRVGTELQARNVRRAFRTVLRDIPGMDPEEWTPRELRHSFVSLLSDEGVPIEEISRLVGHRSTAVTETVYRRQIRPVIQTGATTMDKIFGGDEEEDDPAQEGTEEPDSES
ncbi:site-specific integrase [Streptomyces sp. WMMB303]|uniref:site-specific integrase n=1 Tax=Streptomyces sp. WMMB303 TaxID=3034154 RepID=UPI0023ECFA77|nr:site-specific integrase [Streptomyces sp. WMMB303]MDF4250455.1 site-specific integrase [Streptomyces sp. WMMB303]